MVMRGRKRKGVRYFGPYAHAYAIRETLDLLLRTFPIRTCIATTSSTSTSGSAGRACCSTSRSARARASARSTRRPTASSSTSCATSSTATPTPIVKRLEREMRAAADELEFERAARLRDRLAARAQGDREQQMVADRNEDLDVIGIADDELEAAVQVFYVRRGRVVGRKGFVVDKVEDLTPGELVDRILEDLYGDDPPLGVPKQVLVPDRARRRATLRGVAHRAARARGCRSGCRSAATSGRCWRRSPATPRRSSPATGCAGPATTTAGAGRSTSCRTTSACPRRRCASSATT